MRLGIGVSREAIDAVAVRRGRIVWTARRALEDGSEIGSALAELAGRRPKAARRVTVAIESDLCQVKVLTNLPRLSRARLRRAVALQWARWFLTNGGPAVTAAEWLDGRSRALAAATEARVVRAVVDGCAAAGLRVRAVVPAPVAVSERLPEGVHRRRVGTYEEILTVERGRLVSFRRTPAGRHRPNGRDRPPSAALAAARAPAWLGFAHTARGAARAGPAGKRRIGRLAAAAIVVWGVAAAVFVVRTERANAAAEAELLAMGEPLQHAIGVEHDLQRLDAVLAAFAGATATRSRDLRLLAVLTAAFPDSAYLVSLRRSGDTVLLAGVAPSASGLLARLDTVPGIDDPALRGPVTREASAGAVRERFGLRFFWHPEGIAP